MLSVYQNVSTLFGCWGGGYTFSEPGMKKVAAELCHFTVGKTAKDVLWILAEKLVLML